MNDWASFTDNQFSRHPKHCEALPTYCLQISHLPSDEHGAMQTIMEVVEGKEGHGKGVDPRSIRFRLDSTRLRQVKVTNRDLTNYDPDLLPSTPRSLRGSPLR